MKRKVKSYFAFTTVSYRIIGLVLLPLLLLLSSGVMICHNGNFYLQMMLYNYVLTYELIADHWVLGGCFSDKGRSLRYFKTSLKGVEVLGNVAVTDLMRKFLYCMVFSMVAFLLTGQKIDIVNGLVVYCVMVGVLHGSRHIDVLQRMMGLAFLAQIPMAIINVVNNGLISLAVANVVNNYMIFYTGVGEWITLTCLTILYGVTAIVLSRLMVRRITDCVRQSEKEERN